MSARGIFVARFIAIGEALLEAPHDLTAALFDEAQIPRGLDHTVRHLPQPLDGHWVAQQPDETLLFGVPGAVRRLERIEPGKRAAELRRETTEVRRHLRQAAAKPKEALRLEQQIGRDGAGGRGHGRGRLSRRDGLDLRGELFERRIKRLMRLGFLSGEGGRDHIVFLSNSQTGDSLRPAGGDVDKLGAGTLEVVVGQWVKWNILHETDCSRG